MNSRNPLPESHAHSPQWSCTGPWAWLSSRHCDSFPLSDLDVDGVAYVLTVGSETTTIGNGQSNPSLVCSLS